MKDRRVAEQGDGAEVDGVQGAVGQDDDHVGVDDVRNAIAEAFENIADIDCQTALRAVEHEHERGEVLERLDALEDAIDIFVVG